MSILSDNDILLNIMENKLVINPLNINNVQPASVDLHLSNDLKKIDGTIINLDETGTYTLAPLEFILGSTLEYVEIPRHLVAKVDGRSSIARLGISIHETAGYIDPGYKGDITLEIFNSSNQPFELKKGISICQLILETLTSPCQRAYGDTQLGSKYQESKGTVLSRYNGGK